MSDLIFYKIDEFFHFIIELFNMKSAAPPLFSTLIHRLFLRTRSRFCISLSYLTTKENLPSGLN